MNPEFDWFSYAGIGYGQRPCIENQRNLQDF